MEVSHIHKTSYSNVIKINQASNTAVMFVSTRLLDVLDYKTSTSFVVY